MTEDDQHLEIGKMVEERQRARGRLVCLENRLRTLRLALEHTTAAIDEHTGFFVSDSGRLVAKAMSHVQGCQKDAEYPEGKEIAALLNERIELRERIAELDDKLGPVGC